MNLKYLARALKIKSLKRAGRLKRVGKSYVSLFLIIVLGIGATTAWFSNSNSISVSSPTLKMNSSSGMQDNQLQVKQIEIALDNFRLEEASSVDGRNIYFPASFTDNVSDAASANIVTSQSSNSSDILVDYAATNQRMDAQTNAMRFREGNAGDKMIRYAYADTVINSGGVDTNVWLKGYKVELTDKNGTTNTYQDKIDLTYSGSKPTGQYFPDTCPVRIAIIDDSGHKPKVFDPSARIKDYVVKTNAVYKITNEGSPTLHEMTELDSFSSYYYGTDNPIFTIEGGKSKNITVVAWLEGTHPYANKFIGGQMSFQIEIETNVNEMEEVYLHDWTIGDEHDNGAHNMVTASNYMDYESKSGAHWLSGNVNVVMSYYDPIAQTYKVSTMTKQTDTDSKGYTVYKTAIPKYVDTKISFYRLSKHGDDVFDGTVYNAWHTYDGADSSVRYSGWKILGSLASTRHIGSTTTNYSHYYAIRGNGYGTVAHNDSNRYEHWLSPCIGYWGTETGPVSTS